MDNLLAQRLYERVCVKVALHWHRQTPYLVGDKERDFFSKEPRAHGFLTVEADRLGALWNSRKVKIGTTTAGTFMPGHLQIQKIMDIKKQGFVLLTERQEYLLNKELT